MGGDKSLTETNPHLRYTELIALHGESCTEGQVEEIEKFVLLSNHCMLIWGDGGGTYRACKSNDYEKILNPLYIACAEKNEKL